MVGRRALRQGRHRRGPHVRGGPVPPDHRPPRPAAVPHPAHRGARTPHPRDREGRPRARQAHTPHRRVRGLRGHRLAARRRLGRQALPCHARRTQARRLPSPGHRRGRPGRHQVLPPARGLEPAADRPREPQPGRRPQDGPGARAPAHRRAVLLRHALRAGRVAHPRHPAVARHDRRQGPEQARSAGPSWATSATCWTPWPPTTPAACGTRTSSPTTSSSTATRPAWSTSGSSPTSARP